MTDVAGNVSANSPALSFTVDSQIGTPAAPTLVAGFDTGVSTSDGITQLGSVTLQGQSAEPGATLSVFNGATALGSVTVGADGSWTLAVSLPAGSHSLMARQTDVAGNVSALSAALNLTVDNSVSALGAPQLVAADDTGTVGDATTTQALARVSGSGAEANARIDVYADGVYRGTTQADGAGAWQFTPSGVWGSGLVNITAVQTDVAGNVSATSSALALNVMTQPSALSAPILATASAVAATDVAGAVTNSTTPTVQGSGAVPGATVTVYNGATALGNATADAAGHWSLTLPAQTNGSGLNLSVSQTVRGHESDRSAPLTVTVDTAAVANTQLSLATSSDSGLAGDRVTNDTTPTLQGTFAGQANVVVTVAKDGTTVGQALTDANGNWSFTSAALTAGVHSFTATPAGGSPSQPLVLTVDSSASTLAAPVLSADSDTGTSASDGVTSLRNVTLTGTGAEAGATVEVMAGTVVVGRAVAAADGSYAVLVQGLADGANALTVRQTDVAGNESSTSAALAVQVVVKAAASAPQILGISAATDSGLLGDNTTRNTTPVLQGTGAEANATVQVWNGSTLLGQAQADAAGQWSLTLSALPSGTHGLVARQVDVAGNVSADSAPFALTIDTSASAPTLGLLATADNDTGILGDGRTQNGTPIFTGVAEAGATVTLWRVDQGTPQSMGTAVADAAGVWQVELQQGLAPANYKFAASQVDVSGNNSSTSSPLHLTIQPLARVNLTSLLDGAARPQWVKLFDYNQDGLVDVVTNQKIYLQGSDGVFGDAGITMALAESATPINLFGGDEVAFIDQKNKLTIPEEEVRLSFPILGQSDGNIVQVGLANLLGQGTDILVLQSQAYLPVVKTKFVALGGVSIPNDSGGGLYFDFNADGLLDLIRVNPARDSWIGQGDGTFTNFRFPTGSYVTVGMVFDANGDGLLDVFQGDVLQINQGGDAPTFVNQYSLAGLPYYRYSEQITQIVVGDMDGDGQEDIGYGVGNNPLNVFLNHGGVFVQSAENLLFEGALNLDSWGTRSNLSLADIDNNRSLDLLYANNSDQLGVLINKSVIREDSYLRVVVTDPLGDESRMTGAVVELYNSTTGDLVATRVVNVGAKGSYTRQNSNLFVEFFGLDSTQSYDIAVRYPGNDNQGVTVVTGRAGFGTHGIDSNLLNQIVDGTLAAVSPGGKDVLYVSPEDRATATTGGKTVGTGLSDWMVGDAGNDVFLPNGSPLGEAGDTIDMRNGGSDTIVFQQVANLNTAATVLGADLTSALGGGGDVLDVAGLLTAIGYTGARNATDVASVLQVVANGTGLTVRANKPGVGFQDLAHVQPPAGGDISGKTLADLVASGHLRLGGLKLSGAASATLDENTAQLGGTKLFANVALAADGAAFGRGFDGGTLRVHLDNAYAEDRWTVAAGNGVTVAGNTVSVDGTAVATVHATDNGQGKDLLLTFGFSGSALTEAQQAQVVQRVAQAIDYTNTGSTPPDYARSLKLTVSDGAASAVDATLLTVTPVADTEVINGVRWVTGTAAVDTLGGSALDEMFVGYGGPVANAGTASATGDSLTGGGGADTFVYRAGNVGKDVITDFALGTFGTDANADRLQLSDVLQGYVAGTSDLNDFVRLVDNGTSVSVQVDFNGKADGSVFQHYLEVQLTGVTLAGAGAADVDTLRQALINNGQLVI